MRNQPDIYRYSRANRTISWREHIDWIIPIILGKSNKELFIIENFEMPVGQIRLDYKDPKEAEISISILKEFQGRGFTTKALSLTIKMVKNKNKVKLLIAVIHKKIYPLREFLKNLILD